MTSQNRQLATLLRAIANLLSSRETNPYRVRAYRCAADSLEHLAEDVGVVAQRGELQGIPGIGKEMAAKIEEFLSQGRIRTYEELKSPLPVEVKSWVELPGFSEPLVHDLYVRLKITTLDDLERLVRSEMLRTIPGMNLPTEAVLDAIRTQRENIKREDSDVEKTP